MSKKDTPTVSRLTDWGAILSELWSLTNKKELRVFGFLKFIRNRLRAEVGNGKEGTQQDFWMEVFLWKWRKVKKCKNSGPDDRTSVSFVSRWFARRKFNKRLWQRNFMDKPHGKCIKLRFNSEFSRSNRQIDALYEGGSLPIKLKNKTQIVGFPSMYEHSSLFCYDRGSRWTRWIIVQQNCSREIDRCYQTAKSSNDVSAWFWNISIQTTLSLFLKNLI